ncbi:MAG: hypothetical protein MHM6MM_000720 [Cercozoa sp. M6MM]
MTMAWIFFVPVAVFAAMLRRKNWFRAHKFCIASAFTCTIVALVLSVTATTGAHFKHLHGVLGLCVIILAFLQVTTGLLRPHKPDQPVIVTVPASKYRSKPNTSPQSETPSLPEKSTARRVFEVFHGGNGKLAALLALIVIPLGLEQLRHRCVSAECNSRVNATQILSIVCAAALGVIGTVFYAKKQLQSASEEAVKLDVAMDDFER